MSVYCQKSMLLLDIYHLGWVGKNWQIKGNQGKYNRVTKDKEECGLKSLFTSQVFLTHICPMPHLIPSENTRKLRL